MSTFRQYRWLWVLAAAGVCLLGLWLALPMLVSRFGESYLKRQGIEEVRLQVQSIGTHNATVLRSRAATAEWEMDVDLLQVEYRLSALWKQRLRQLNVDGARLTWTLPERLVPDPEPDLLPPPVAVWRPERRFPVEPVDVEESVEETDRPPVEIVPGPVARDVETALFPRTDPFAALYQIPVREMQLSRSTIDLRYGDHRSPAVAVDLALRPSGAESHWRLDVGTPGLTTQLDMQVDGGRERVRLSGAVNLRARSQLGDWEDWLGRVDGLPVDLPEALDWNQLQLQFLNEWQSGRMRMLSLQAELRDISWRSDRGTEWGGSNHAVATWTIEDKRSVLFFGAGIEGFGWQDFSFGDGYAEGQVEMNEDRVRLQWAPVTVHFRDLLLGEIGGELQAGLEQGLQAQSLLRWQTAGPVAESVPLQLNAFSDLQDAAVIQLQLGDESAAAELSISSDWEHLARYRGQGRLQARLAAEALNWIPLDMELADELFGWHSGELRGEVEWDSRGFLPRGRGELVLDGLGWTDPTGQTELRNLRGRVPFRFLGPPQVLGRPEIRADQLTVAGFEIEDLELRFRLPAVDALDIESFSALVAGGRVTLRPFRVDLQNPSADTVIEFHDLDARQLQALLPESGYLVDGRLNGRLPLRYRNGQWALGEGYLRLDAQRGGTFRFIDEDFLRETIPLDADQLDIGERFYEALMQGVQLKAFEIHLLDPTQPDVPLYLSLAGEARTDRLVVPIEGLVIRNRIDPADLRDLMDMLGLGWLSW